MSPISYSSQHAYTTIHNSSPYFTHMNARYDRSIGREHELQRELGVERAEYGNGNGKFVSRDSGPTPPRQTLPSFKELFGDIRLLNMDSHRNISSSSSSSSTSSSLSSVSQPVIKASHSNYSRRISGSPTKPSVSLVDHIFYSSEEEDETDGYFRRRLPFRYSREPSLAEQSLSDAEEELLERDRIEDQNSYSFSPGRRRSTTFETSSERGLWTNTTRFPEIKAQKRSSEPAISLPSPLPTSDSDLGTSQSFPSPARHVSEPAPQSGLVHQGRSFVNDKSIAPSRSSPMRPREISLPASSPPMSPASSLSPIREKPSDSSPSCPDDVATVESGCPSCLEGYRSVSPPGDMVRPTEDIVMGGIDSNGDDSHETQGGLVTHRMKSANRYGPLDRTA
ncbi:hypothetical protein E1B28_003883 [Marasmius oreades]|uniref:Uncharacterized protein n=1 Tax=Marasmius oreades TaxID=181124 RepID=A0A9P8ABQ2_9AGAR|nr:uncharacterized protein E1B28_003883 [Marasmius oreades]KAG7096447.1 hypothetical protein E1B28_003883 [Marasmius oreades]